MAIGKKIRNQNQIRITDSVDNAEIILGLCEGEIEGLENGAQSFYIGDTPLQDTDGNDNFEDFDLNVYPGSGVNEKINYSLDALAQPHQVGQQLSYDKPKVVYGTLNNIDYLDIRIVINYLLDNANSKGKLRDYSVNVLIEYQRASEGDTWHNISGINAPFTFVGQVTSNTVQQFKVKVPRVNEPYVIRVTKKSPDANNTTYHNQVTFESFSEGVVGTREFPHTAIAQIYIKSSDQLSSIPSLSGVYKLNRIRVPTNYKPETHTYSGNWDGSFKMEWSDNPAWCLYDFIMNDRYGMNAYAPVTIDKWDCYEAAQWCDGLVPNGKGGYEPRFTCNLVQSEATNGREFASYLAGLFNAFLVEPSTGYLRLFIDKDAEPVFLFTPENITEDGFSYSFTNPETRYNDIKVSFTNPEMNWEADTRRLIDYIDTKTPAGKATYDRIQEDIDFNGRVTYDFIAVGCIRESEALRRAFYKLNMALNEKMQVTFTTNRQAQCLSNFDIILISDPTLGFAVSGRIKSVSEDDRKTIYLRDSIYIETNQEEFIIKFNTPDGVYEAELEPFEQPGRTKELRLKNPLPTNIPEAGTFSISSVKLGTPKPFRITSIAEVEGNPDQYTITAMELDRGKWDAADKLVLADPVEYSSLPSASDVPHILDLSFYQTYDPVDLENEITLTPVYVDNYPYYSGNIQVYTRLKDIEAEWTQQTVVRNTVIEDMAPGEYEFVVLPISINGVTPPFDTATTYTYTVQKVNTYPSTVKNFAADPNVNGVTLSWDAVTDIDLAGYEIRAGEDWDSAEVIISDYQGTSLFVPLTHTKTQYYAICAKNYLGNYSQFPAYVSTAVLAPDDVPAFYATVSNDRVRFDWTQVEGTDIEYEIRLGNNWSTAQKVASVKGNNTTVLLPSGANIYYCIKAKSLLGLYSYSPRYAQLDMLLKPDRNIILRYDNGADDFVGYSYNIIPYVPAGASEPTPNVMQLTNTSIYGEHFFSVELDKTTRARNWLETTAFSNPARLTWNDFSDVRYSSERAHVMWLGSQNLEMDGTLETVIAKWVGLESWGGYLAFPYSEDTNDLLGEVSPTESESITFTDGYLSGALVLDENTYLEYDNITIPSVFTLSFKLKIKLPASDVGRPMIEGVNLIRLVGDNGRYIKLFIRDNQLVCQASDGKDIEIDIDHATDLDFVTIAIVQSQTERVLYFYSNYVNFENYKVIEVAPMGQFNKYYINRKLGDVL